MQVKTVNKMACIILMSNSMYVFLEKMKSKRRVRVFASLEDERKMSIGRVCGQGGSCGNQPNPAQSSSHMCQRCKLAHSSCFIHLFRQYSPDYLGIRVT